MAQTAPPTPAVPSGKWNVGYQPDHCYVARQYGEGGDAYTVGIKPVTWGKVADVLVVRPSDGADYRLGKGSVMLDHGERIAGRVRSWQTADGGSRIVALEVPRDKIAAIAGATTLDIDADGQRTIVAQKGGAAVAAALAACEKKLTDEIDALTTSRDSLHPDPKSRAYGAPESEWITPLDYPAEAARSRWQGVTSVRWVVDADGRVRRCWITGRSDNPGLDDLVCKLVKDRASYRSMLTADGKPASFVAGRIVTWSVEN
ncbi:MAG: TonB family protein [Sphingomonas taxi]